MRYSIRAVLVALLVIPASLSAQSPASCQQANRDACFKANDLYSYMLPQLGLGISGGNPVLGSSKAIGKFGHFSLGLRATGVQGALPKFDNVTISPLAQQNSQIPTKNTWIPMPAFDAAIGLFNGFQVGVTRVAQLDGLVTFIYVPDIGKANDNSGDANIKVESHTRFGFGGRLGLLEESVVIPGISVTYVDRGLPKLSVNSTSNGTSFGVDKLDMTATTWRVMATKTFLLFGFSAGYGGDNYKSTGDITAMNPVSVTPDSVSLKRSLNRANWFLNLTLNMGPAKLGFEYGRGASISVPTENTFTPVAGAATNYASVGLRFGW